MKEKSLTSFFKLYDIEFDRACKDLGVKNIPSWKDRWLYRYMQINPFFRYFPYEGYLEIFYSDKKTIKEKRKLLKKLRKNKEVIYDKNYSKNLRHCFYPTFFLSPKLYNNFSEWWFLYAKNILYGSPETVCLNFFKESFYIRSDHSKKTQEEIRNLWLEANREEIDKLVQSAFDSFTLIIPRYGDKKRILNEIKTYLKVLHNDSAYIPQSKITQKTAMDAYSLLETMVREDNVNLITLASNADILKTSRMNISNKLGKDSVNSVRVGTHRLKIIARKILEASSYGIFPQIYENQFSRNDHLESFLINIPQLMTYESYEIIKKSFPKQNDMYDVIRNDLMELGDIIFKD